MTDELPKHLADRVLWNQAEGIEMAHFNIDAHLSNGKRLDWLVVVEEGESLRQAADQVRKAAAGKFGPACLLLRWGTLRASNGMVTVSMWR